MQKVTVSASPKANSQYPQTLLSQVEVALYSGERFSSEVSYPRGHSKNPMTDSELEHKFRSQTRGLLASALTDNILDHLWNLEKVDDIGQVIEMIKL